MRVTDGLGVEQVFGMWWVKRNACRVGVINWSEGLTLIWIVKTSAVTACTGLIRPWTGTSSGCCEHGNEHSGSTIYVRGISVICVTCMDHRR